MTIDGIDPISNNDRVLNFYQRVRAQMLSKNIENRTDKKSWDNFLTRSYEFSWIDIGGDSFFDGPIMLKLIMNEANPHTRVDKQFLKDNIKKSWLLTDIKKNHDGIV